MARPTPAAPLHRVPPAGSGRLGGRLCHHRLPAAARRVPQIALATKIDLDSPRFVGGMVEGRQTPSVFGFCSKKSRTLDILLPLGSIWFLFSETHPSRVQESGVFPIRPCSSGHRLVVRPEFSASVLLQDPHMRRPMHPCIREPAPFMRRTTCVLRFPDVSGRWSHIETRTSHVPQL